VVGSETQNDDAGSLKTIYYTLGFVLFLAGQGIRYLVNHMKDTSGNPKAPAWIDTTFIVALTLTEAIAVFSLVLGFGGATLQNYLPLFVISGVGMLLLFPSSFFRIEKTTNQ
jgi:F0F1-type ATP synthase membrane subunit c/vacuolar-type H+-ATPase subunit K